MSVPVNTYITSELIANDARYTLTRYTADDTDKIVAVYNELNLMAAVTEEMEFAAHVWLAVYAPDAGSLFSQYEVRSAVDLCYLMIDEHFGFDTSSGSGGSEKYPLSTWKRWIKEHKVYQAKLKAAFEYAKVDMISQATNVNWWAA